MSLKAVRRTEEVHPLWRYFLFNADCRKRKVRVDLSICVISRQEEHDIRLDEEPAHFISQKERTSIHSHSK